MTDPERPALPTRQAPPPFRTVVVAASERVSARLQRITLDGPDLEGFTVSEPASSVRLLLPSVGRSDLVIPTWHGNEFLLSDGARPAIRTLTPSWSEAAAPPLTVDVVLHQSGLLTDWARTVPVGASVAVSGPGRGYHVDPSASAFVVAGDESALPALTQVLRAIPGSIPTQVVVETADPAAIERLPQRAGITIDSHLVAADAPPGAAMSAALADLPIDPDTAVWVAGEAAAVQRVRRRFFVERGIARSQCTIRGYWKAGRAGTDGT